MQIRKNMSRLQQSVWHRGGAQQPLRLLIKLFMSSSVLRYEVEFPWARNNM